MVAELEARANRINPVEIRPYEAGQRLANEIVPPVWNKRVSEDEQMAQVWKAARDSLRVGPILVVSGTRCQTLICSAKSSSELPRQR